jgi:hypothetical protein
MATDRRYRFAQPTGLPLQGDTALTSLVSEETAEKELELRRKNYEMSLAARKKASID